MNMHLRSLAQLVALVAISSASALPRGLSFDDVLLLNSDGSHSIIKNSEFSSLQARGIIEPAPRAADVAASPKTPNIVSKKNKRDCEKSVEVQVISDTSFLNWDVALSTVISAQGGSATASIMEGFMIADSLAVTATATMSNLKMTLSASLSLTYSRTWTSQEQQTLTFIVPDGQFGVVVSNPFVRRVEGNNLDGCTGNWTSEPFTGDKYTSQNYGNLVWPTGAIRLCNSTSYPVPYCIGEGSHF